MSTENDARARLRLHIGKSRTEVRSDEPGMAKVGLALGSSETAREFFRHAPPTALEIEHAIEAIEDALFGIRHAIAPGGVLLTADVAIRHIARVAGVDDQGDCTLSRDLIEQTFDRLVCVASGRPLVQEALPSDPEFAATLVILREFMHHLQFGSIRVTSESNTEGKHFEGHTS